MEIYKPCCYYIPPKQWSKDINVGGGPFRSTLWELVTVAKIPEAISVLVTFAVAIVLIVGVAMSIIAELVSVAGDPAFQTALQAALMDFNQDLKMQFALSISQLENLNVTDNSTHTSMTAEEIGTAAGPFLIVINDVVFTLLLCLYMLSTRTPDAEEDVYKKPEVMTLSEKIKVR